jgi:hypothetical protein
MAAYVNTAEGLAGLISDFVNNGGNVTDLATHMANDHATLQSLKFNMVMEFLRIMGEKPYMDARNEYAVRAAKVGYRAIVDNLNGATRVLYV